MGLFSASGSCWHELLLQMWNCSVANLFLSRFELGSKLLLVGVSRFWEAGRSCPCRRASRSVSRSRQSSTPSVRSFPPTRASLCAVRATGSLRADSIGSCVPGQQASGSCPRGNDSCTRCRAPRHPSGHPSHLAPSCVPTVSPGPCVTTVSALVCRCIDPCVPTVCGFPAT